MRWLDYVRQLAARWLTIAGPRVAATLAGTDLFAMCADGDERIPAYPTEVVDGGAGDAS
jgi:fructokinase